MFFGLAAMSAYNLSRFPVLSRSGKVASVAGFLFCSILTVQSATAMSRRSAMFHKNATQSPEWYLGVEAEAEVKAE